MAAAAADPSNPSGAKRRLSCAFPTSRWRAVAFGRAQDLPKGTVLFSRGGRTVDSFLVLAGRIEIYEDGPDGGPNVFTIHGKHHFTGELAPFDDRDFLVGGRMGEDGRAARMSRPQFRRPPSRTSPRPSGVALDGSGFVRVGGGGEDGARPGAAGRRASWKPAAPASSRWATRAPARWNAWRPRRARVRSWCRPSTRCWRGHEAPA